MTDNTIAKRKRTQELAHKTKYCVTRTPLKTGGKLRFSGRVSRSCSTSSSRRIYIYIYKLNNNRHFPCVEYYNVWHDISGGNSSPVSMFLILLHVALLLKSVIQCFSCCLSYNFQYHCIIHCFLCSLQFQRISHICFSVIAFIETTICMRNIKTAIVLCSCVNVDICGVISSTNMNISNNHLSSEQKDHDI